LAWATNSGLGGNVRFSWERFSSELMAVRLPFAVPSHKEKKGKERKRKEKKS